tara:strand:- start:1087 stop:1797 length:711 start_codon:yes stop_codon:yes gene_type:complete
MPSQNKIMKALKKVKKAKKAKKAKRRSRATQEIKQIVNLKGLGGLGSPPAPFVFQTQREGPVSASEDFFTKALKQLNRVNAPSENIQQVKENIKKLERDISKQDLTNKRLIFESDLLKLKYDNIKSRTDGVGDFSQKNNPRNVAKEEEKLQDKANLTTSRSNRGPMSEESKQKGRETRARNKALRESQTQPSIFRSQSAPVSESEPITEEGIDYQTRRDIRLGDVVKKSDEEDIFI